jgi:hypothetical protein
MGMFPLGWMLRSINLEFKYYNHWKGRQNMSRTSIIDSPAVTCEQGINVVFAEES